MKDRTQELSSPGDRLYRAARFEDAERAYLGALDLDRDSLEAHPGIGKIGLLLSDRHKAARHYSAAYRIAPRNPDENEPALASA